MTHYLSHNNKESPSVFGPNLHLHLTLPSLMTAWHNTVNTCWCLFFCLVAGNWQTSNCVVSPRFYSCYNVDTVGERGHTNRRTGSINTPTDTVYFHCAVQATGRGNIASCGRIGGGGGGLSLLNHLYMFVYTGNIGLSILCRSICLLSCLSCFLAHLSQYSWNIRLWEVTETALSGLNVANDL